MGSDRSDSLLGGGGRRISDYVVTLEAQRTAPMAPGTAQFLADLGPDNIMLQLIA